MTQILVIGAGAAGLVAALAAANSGVEVLLLERSDGTDSNLAISGGLVAAAGTEAQKAAGVVDDEALWRSDVRHATRDGADPTVSRLVTRHGARALSVVGAVCDTSVRLIDDIVFPGHSRARLHEIGGFDGVALAAALRAAATSHPGVTFAEGIDVDELMFEDGRVAGARSGATRFHAEATVLAAGGYGAGPALLSRYLSDMTHAQYIGSSHSDGRLLAQLVARGVPVRDMAGYQGHGHATVVGTGRLGAGLTTVGAMLVNRDGLRFVNEETGPSGLAAHVGAQPGGRALEIYTQAMHDGFLRFASYRDAVSRGAAQRFETLDALCTQHGVPIDALERTLAGFNAAAEGRSGDQYGRTAFRGAIAAPFWAVEVTAALVHTQGGLTVDERSAVLAAQGRPIPGLLAAGGCVVGLTGNGPEGYLPGHGLAQSITLGLIAGESAAASVARGP